MRLIEALRYSHPSSIAFVGAGGKTTALFRAARELLPVSGEEGQNKTVIVTTTTHFGHWQAGLADHFIPIYSLSDIEKLKKDLPKGVLLLTGEKHNNFLGGLSPNLLDEIRILAEDHDLPLLIEADGSHSHPLKAPAEHEPAIPDFTQNVVVVAGLRGLGRPLMDDWVHRPEKFAELSGLHPGEEITGHALAKVLLHPDGGLKNIPHGARRIALLNQADSSGSQSQAKMISEQLVPVFHSSIIASLSRENAGVASCEEQNFDLPQTIYAVFEQIGGIILAAGGSSRFGKPKQLVKWKGQPLIRHVAIAALKAGLSPVVVVVGAASADVLPVINDLPLRIVINPNWVIGLSSSIQIGISSLPKETGGAVFLQGDQPQIPHTLIKSLIEAHQLTLNPIVAPLIDGQRSNPVLFDSGTFSQLLTLEGEMGGRALFVQFPVQWVTWHDSKLLLDIDTTEDYQKFLEIYPQDEVLT
jgi:molybdenum cofactor cytidylyltransferase